MLASIRRRCTLPGRAGSALVALALAGCASFTPQVGPGPEPVASYVDLTTPFVAIGDTQEHLSTGYPLHDNDSAVDAYVEVTQRPPELPLFGRRTMEWALQRFPEEPYVHLGDVMDLSCRTEAERMTKIFRATGRAGAILPGNHDGLMFGIYGYNILDAMADTNAPGSGLRQLTLCRPVSGGACSPGACACTLDCSLMYRLMKSRLLKASRAVLCLPSSSAAPRRQAWFHFVASASAAASRML
jgi:hypothetical protein